MTLEMLLTQSLQDLYQSESEQIRRLSQFAHVTTNSELRTVLEQHQQDTEQHVQRLSQVLGALGETAGGLGRVPAGLQGLIAEAENEILQESDESFRDLAVIASSQKLEHYEIAAYGIARAMAHTLGLSDEARILQDTLSEERQADQRLTRISLVLLKQAGQKQPTEV